MFCWLGVIEEFALAVLPLLVELLHTLKVQLEKAV
jgi:hypothetical protein